MFLLKSWTKWVAGLQLLLALPETCQTLGQEKSTALARREDCGRAKVLPGRAGERGWLASLTFAGDTFCIL